MELFNPLTLDDIQGLIVALVKYGTLKPMEHSKVMSVSAFSDLFTGWEDNWCISNRDLGLKTICLLALSAMLRPSDIVPNDVIYDPKSGRSTPAVFTTECVDFNSDGSMTLRFHGIKNNTQRSGFEVVIQPYMDKKARPSGYSSCLY